MPSGDPGSNEGERGYTFTYDPGTGEPTTTVIEAVAWLTGRDEMDLEPIANSIDTDALEAIFSERETEKDFYRSSRSRPQTNVMVDFEYEGCTVTVESGQITVERQ